MIKVNINKASWEFRQMEEDVWYKAQVPGSLFLDMQRNGLIKEPYYRFNERQFARLAEKDYEYRCNFYVEEEFTQKKKQNIVFEGIDTLSSIWLNNQKISDTDNMHRTYRFPVNGLLKPGLNHLRIRLYSPMRYIREQHEKQPLPEMNTASPHGFSQIRKIHSSFGWDAEPIVPDSGIWRDVYLEGYEDCRIQDIYVRQIHENGTVRLKIETNLEKEALEEYGIGLVLNNPDGQLELKREIDELQGDRIIFEESIHNPKLWWPNGYGEHPLYELTVYLYQKINGRLEDSHTFRIGLRKAEVRREKDQWGESFAFYINDIPVFAKGGCYTPPDKFLPLCRGRRHEDLIRFCAEANYNCIRIWGGAVYPDDELYDLCDQYGILIWQDLMFACALYHVTDSFLENICAEVEDNVKRLRHHPSLILWCGNNENEWFHDFQHDLDGLTYELRMDNLRQYEVYLKETVKKFDPDRLFWPSSPSSGGGYKDPNGEEKGDVHCWYVWYLPAKPYTFYKECKARFVSEFGLESFQNLKTLKHYMEPEDMSPNSEVMDFMQRCSDNYCNMGNGKIMNYIFQEVKAPKNFSEYIYASQYAQAEGIKYGASHFRRLKPRCMGSLYWQIVDCFPGTTWSGIDYEYRWKILHYYAKRFYQQTVISAEINDRNVRLYVVHDGQNEFYGNIEWCLRRNDGLIIKAGGMEKKIQKDSAQCIAEMDFSETISTERRTECYFEFSLLDREGRTISYDTALFVKPKHFKFLKPDISWNIQEEGEKLRISLKSSAYVKCVKLDLKTKDVLFSDNCFDLSPDEIKLIYVEKDKECRMITKEELQQELIYECLNSIGSSE